MMEQRANMDSLTTENRVLSSEIEKLNYKQSKLKKKLDRIENRGLENCLLLKGIGENIDEDPSNLMNIVYHKLSKPIDASNEREWLRQIREMNITKCSRIVWFQKDRTRPISLEFQYQQDIEYLLSNRKYLRPGVYLDKEYNAETDRKRRLLRPILKAARAHKDYEKKSRMEEEKLIIDGKTYTVDNLDQLPASLNVVNLTSKTMRSILLSSENSIHFQISIQPTLSCMVAISHQLSSTFSIGKHLILMTL